MIYANPTARFKGPAGRNRGVLKSSGANAECCLYIGLSPCPVTVTTRIIPFLVGNPYKPSFATGILGGGQPKLYNLVGAIIQCRNRSLIVDARPRNEAVNRSSQLKHYQTVSESQKLIMK